MKVVTFIARTETLVTLVKHLRNRWICHYEQDIVLNRYKACRTYVNLTSSD